MSVLARALRDRPTPQAAVFFQTALFSLLMGAHQRVYPDDPSELPFQAQYLVLLLLVGFLFHVASDLTTRATESILALPVSARTLVMGRMLTLGRIGLLHLACYGILCALASGSLIPLRIALHASCGWLVGVVLLHAVLPRRHRVGGPVVRATVLASVYLLVGAGAFSRTWHYPVAMAALAGAGILWLHLRLPPSLELSIPARRRRRLTGARADEVPRARPLAAATWLARQTWLRLGTLLGVLIAYFGGMSFFATMELLPLLLLHWLLGISAYFYAVLALGRVLPAAAHLPFSRSRLHAFLTLPVLLMLVAALLAWSPVRSSGRNADLWEIGIGADRTGERVLHRFLPLVPVYAIEPGPGVAPGPIRARYPSALCTTLLLAVWLGQRLGLRQVHVRALGRDWRWWLLVLLAVIVLLSPAWSALPVILFRLYATLLPEVVIVALAGVVALLFWRSGARRTRQAELLPPPAQFA